MPACALAPAGGGPFPLHRLAEPFEALRDAGEAADPVVRLVSLGPLAEHSERTTFAANLLAVAGIRTTVEAGSPVAVICGTDDRCAAEAVDVARELRVDGVAHVLLVGRPGDRESDWRDAGVDESFVPGPHRAPDPIVLEAPPGRPVIRTHSADGRSHGAIV